eukprot:SAG31_NODE_2590_length_5426_cov_4.118265_9_plen_180_part_00
MATDASSGDGQSAGSDDARPAHPTHQPRDAFASRSRRQHSSTHRSGGQNQCSAGILDALRTTSRTHARTFPDLQKAGLEVIQVLLPRYVAATASSRPGGDVSLLNSAGQTPFQLLYNELEQGNKRAPTVSVEDRKKLALLRRWTTALDLQSATNGTVDADEDPADWHAPALLYNFVHIP